MNRPIASNDSYGCDAVLVPSTANRRNWPPPPAASTRRRANRHWSERSFLWRWPPSGARY